MASCTANGTTSAYTYGADGLRRSMTANGVTTYYAYDGQTMIREMQGEPGSLHATATYLTGPRGPEYRRDDTQPEPDGQGHTFGRTRWYVYDGLGSVTGEVDPLGNVTASDKYDVYGAVRGRTGSASTAHGFVGSLGHLSDAATGLVYMKARYYDPQTGRFQSEDSKLTGNNWFIYADNNPVNEADSSGCEGKAITWLLTGVTNADAFRMGCMCSALALFGPALVKAGSIIGAVNSIAIGLMAVGFFAAGLGSNAPEILASMTVATIGLVREILQAGSGERLLAGASAVASAALTAITAYSLCCVAALGLDEMEAHPNP